MLTALAFLLLSLDNIHQADVFSVPGLPCTAEHYGIFIATQPQGPWLRIAEPDIRTDAISGDCYVRVGAPFTLYVPLVNGQPVECWHGRQSVARVLQ
jgi:hypothetical protein